MRTIFRRLTQSLIISILFVIVLGCSAYAANIDATVPASLPITVSSDGVVTTATNAAIHNYGSSPIFVSSINVTAENGWSLATKDAAVSASIGAKVISMGFNGSWMDASGTVDTSDFDRISSSGTLNLSYDAKIPRVVTAESSSTAATATFVVGLPTAPTMAAGSSWYKSTKKRTTITKITFMDSYKPSAPADEKWTADVNDTGDITCYRTGTEIVIAGNGTGKIQANADSTHMFSNAAYNTQFFKLTSIENLTLLDTSNVTNMRYMFYDCTKLKNLDLSTFNTINATDMGFMFAGCPDVASFDLSELDTTNVTDTSSMFSGCYGLTSLDLSGFDTTNVTDMNDMFEDCSALTNLDLSTFNTTNVTDMSFMFEGCSVLTNLDLSTFNTTNVTDMHYMFSGCSGLTNLNVSTFNTTNVTAMNGMFEYCSGLTSLDVPGFDTTNATGMGYMFANCSGLTSLDLSTFNTTNVTNMNGMFSGCSKLVTIYASDKWNTDKVDNSIYMFSSCTNLRGDISFNTFYVDKTYAKTSGGYLTYKAASTKTLSLNIDPNSGAVTSYDVSTNPISRFRAFLDWSDTANVA